AGIKTKGFKAYAAEYMQPMFFMAPLNVISELSKVVSISFRLYGNIMGGSIIIMVVSHLVYNLVLPPLLNAFFGLFVGTIQAFVFTMLTLVYISVQTK
ncbi:MAG: F0F1 ATP synthase subunit A, partial [Desulfarculaceae bacterium]